MSDDDASLFGDTFKVLGGSVRVIECSVESASGRKFFEHVTVDGFERDCLILSFSKTLSIEQMHRFEGKRAVVRLIDPSRLLLEINDQLGVRGDMREVEYTRGLDRGDFLKSIEDGWQSEVRMRWPTDDGQQRTVTLSAGHAELIDLGTATPVEGDIPKYQRVTPQTETALFAPALF